MNRQTRWAIWERLQQTQKVNEDAMKRKLQCWKSLLWHWPLFIAKIQKYYLLFSQKLWSCQKSTTWHILYNLADFCWKIKGILVQVTWKKIHTVYLSYQHCNNTNLFKNWRTCPLRLTHFSLTCFVCLQLNLF